MRVSQFAYKILKNISDLKETRLLLAVSGGRDSMALMRVFHEIQSKVKLEVGVVHIHHGGSLPFRNQAYELVKGESERLGFAFYSNFKMSSEEFKEPKSQSESDLRQFRRYWIERIKSQGHFELVVLAHHAQDLLETRIIRLVRGTGAQGLVAMKEKTESLLRPFLTHSLAEIINYCQMQKIVWLEDPSNSETHYFRNWIRNVWLPQLENYRPGGNHSLQRSLEIICEEILLAKCSNSEILFDEAGIKRKSLLRMSEVEKRQVVAGYLQKSGLKNYGLRQVDEIIKRLNTKQKQFAFRLLSHQWRVDENHICIVH